MDVISSIESSIQENLINSLNLIIEYFLDYYPENLSRNPLEIQCPTFGKNRSISLKLGNQRFGSMAVKFILFELLIEVQTHFQPPGGTKREFGKIMGVN